MSANFKNRVLTSVTLFFLLILIFNFKLIQVSSLLIIGIFSAIEFSRIIKKVYKNNYFNMIYNYIFVIYIFSFCSLFFIYSSFLQTKIILFSFLLSCVASDIGGYIFGKTFKGPKLSKISPNKTIIGAVGSIICSMTFIGVFNFYFFDNINLKILFTGFSISVACQIGDIFFSYLKRRAKLKDTGNFLPGHGGLLDRIDGILLGIPIGFITLIILF